MHHDVSRNTLLLCRESPPLTKIFTQFRVHFCNGGLGGGFWRVRARERNSCCGFLRCWPLRLNCICKPIESAAAGIARVAFFKFWVLAKMRANLAMTAVCRFHKIPNGVIALPGAIFFGGIGQLSNEISEQSRVSLLPKHNTVRGLSVAARAS